MSDLLNVGAGWLADALDDNASQSIVYRRGSQSLTLTALIGYQNIAAGAAFGGVIFERDNLDFIVKVSKLKIAGVEVEPDVNDEIDFGGTTYRVSRPDQSSPCFYGDVDGLTYRIHAKVK